MRNSIYYNKFKRLSGKKVCDEIVKFFDNQGYPLTEKQSRELYDYWGEDRGIYEDLGMPFQAYQWSKQTYHKKWWVRLTIPFFFIWLILLFIIRPIKWVFTGSWWFENYSWFEAFTKRWYIEMFEE